VDRFVHAALDAAELTPSVPAKPEVLLRRLAFVLTGLPPSPHQRDPFLQHWQFNSSAAYERLVDELLASPIFNSRLCRASDGGVRNHRAEPEFSPANWTRGRPATV
jgi:Protein of unknown function (DUF1549)